MPSSLTSTNALWSTSLIYNLSLAIPEKSAAWSSKAVGIPIPINTSFSPLETVILNFGSVTMTSLVGGTPSSQVDTLAKVSAESSSVVLPASGSNSTIDNSFPWYGMSCT